MITHYFEFDEKLDLLAHQVLAMCNAFEWRHTEITCFNDLFYIHLQTEGQKVVIYFVGIDEHFPLKLFINGVKFHIDNALSFKKVMQAYIDRTI